MRIRLVSALVLGLLLAACAPALRKPPSVAELTGGPAGYGPEDVDGLLEQAERLYAKHELDAVRRSAKTWLAAAAADETRTEALAGASRAGVWLSDVETETEARHAAALSAVQAAQLCKGRAPGEPACDYWLALGLGVQARERRATAYDALPRIVRLLESVIEREPEMEQAGPHRVLALVLLRAPGWPSGPGDPDRGLEHARLAVTMEPDYPPNQLCLAEGLAEVGEVEQSLEAYRRAAALAKNRVESGDPEARDWLAEAERHLAATTGG